MRGYMTDHNRFIIHLFLCWGGGGGGGSVKFSDRVKA